MLSGGWGGVNRLGARNSSVFPRRGDDKTRLFRRAGPTAGNTSAPAKSAGAA